MPSEFHSKDYVVEYAKSGRSHCHSCRNLIGKNSLRIARVVPAASFEGDVEVWYHPICLFNETWQHPLYPEDIENLGELDRDAMKTLIRVVKQFGASEHCTSDAHSGLVMEYARSGKSECRGCYEEISRNELRLGFLKHPPDESAFHSVVPEWHHVLCFFNRPDYWDLGVESVHQFGGYRFIEDSDLRKVEDLIRMKADGQKIPGARKVQRAWRLKESGYIIPKRSMSRKRSKHVE